MDVIFITIGQRIAEKRKSLNLSQEKLAELTGFHRNYIGIVERAERSANLQTIILIAKSLNMTLEELFKDL